MPARVRRWLIVGLVAAAAVSGPLPQAGRAVIHVRRIDTSVYPTIRILVVAPIVSSVPPALTVNGVAAVGVTAQNLADQQSIALVIDRSQSMHGAALASATRAAEAFVADKPPPDQISVITAGSQATTLADFSALPDSAAAALRGLTIDTRYGTVLNDAVVLAAQSLRAHGLSGRAIILVSDGQETTSRATRQAAIQAARAAGAPIYTIGIPDQTYMPKPLRELAAGTGGRFIAAPSTAALPSIYRAIGAELRRTWRLNFVTAARPGDTLKLEIRTDGQRVTVTTHLAVDSSKSGRGLGGMVLLTFSVLLAGALLVALVVSLRSSTLLHHWRRQESDYE
jgi:VWFA-related protein